MGKRLPAKTKTAGAGSHRKRRARRLLSRSNLRAHPLSSGQTPWLQSTPGLSESVAHLVLRYEGVRWDRHMSDPVVVSFGGQHLPHVRAV